MSEHILASFEALTAHFDAILIKYPDGHTETVKEYLPKYIAKKFADVLEIQDEQRRELSSNLRLLQKHIGRCAELLGCSGIDSAVEQAIKDLVADHQRRGVEIIHWTEIAGAHLCRAEKSERENDSLKKRNGDMRQAMFKGATVHAYGCHESPDVEACRANQAKEPEGEQLRSELEEWLEKNKIVSILMDTKSNFVSICNGPPLPLQE